MITSTEDYSRTVLPVNEVAHHKNSPPLSSKEGDSVYIIPNQRANIARLKKEIVYKCEGKSIKCPYGVPSSKRMITPGKLRKHHMAIYSFLKHDLGLPTAEREAVFRLLRLATYHAHVYPKADQVAEAPGCSTRSFWRAISRLKGMGLITVVNRFILREEAQISNLYILRRLLLAITRYLHEHSVRFKQSWLKPILSMSGPRFWSEIKKWPLGFAPVAT